MLKFIVVLTISFSSLASSDISDSRIAFEKYMAYQSSSNSKVVNDFISKRVTDEVYDVIATGTPEQIEILKLPMEKRFEKIKFIREFALEDSSCLFYEVTFLKDDNFMVSGQSMEIFFKMVIENKKWKYDGTFVNLTNKSNLEYCKQELQNENQGL
jgi:hypothetical protein